jgi:hypothetical protein
LNWSTGDGVHYRCGDAHSRRVSAGTSICPPVSRGYLFIYPNSFDNALVRLLGSRCVCMSGHGTIKSVPPRSKPHLKFFFWNLKLGLLDIDVSG